MVKSFSLAVTMPAVFPISVSVIGDRLTVKSEPLLVVTSQVVSDTEPLKVIVPPATPVLSAAIAAPENMIAAAINVLLNMFYIPFFHFRCTWYFQGGETAFRNTVLPTLLVG